MPLDSAFNLHRTVTYNQALSIGSLDSLNTSDKTSLVNAINIIQIEAANIGDLSSLTTDSKLTLISSINEIDSNVDINTVNIGDISSLTTTDKSSSVNAINEHDLEIGDLSTLLTRTSPILVDGINSMFEGLVEISCGTCTEALYSSFFCCGNGLVQGIETCDDSNVISGDGCSSNCKRDNFSLSDMNSLGINGSNGITLNGEAAGDLSGYVRYLGDFNGDNIDDIAIGAMNADANGADSGKVYVVFGSKDTLPSTLELSALDGTNGVMFKGIAVNDFAGSSVEYGGDFNGDGLADLLIGAPGVSSNTGQTYLVYGKKGGFTSTIELSSISGSLGVTFNGESTGDTSGFKVSTAGDINNDGITDIIIAAPNATAGGNANAGKLYVVFGKEEEFTSPVSLGSLDGSDGFIIDGARAGAGAGSAVHSAGDFNGDGIDDIIIGAYLSDVGANNNIGQSHVIFGKSTPFAASFDLSSDIDGTTGININGVNAEDFSGQSVAGIGDFNDDGIDDITVSAEGVDTGGSNSGAVYVVFGQKSFASADVELSGINGTNGIVFNGFQADSETGRSVNGIGDYNNDNILDFAIGSRFGDVTGNDNVGKTFIIFGSKNGFTSPFDLSTLSGDNGLVINGIDADDSSGNILDGAADFNGDGIPDVLIGALNADPNGASSGEVYVLFAPTCSVKSPPPNPECITHADCDDADECTVDKCTYEFTCLNLELSCHDNDVCTRDTCSTSTGCDFTSITFCSDSVECCDDGNYCTDEYCDTMMGGCQYFDNSNSCDDGDACTESDMCSGGSCYGSSTLYCDDTNDCTDDSCDSELGCVYTNNSNSCDDFDSCTENDMCSGGSCQGGNQIDCDDFDPCTDDACVSGICENTDNGTCP